MIELVKARQNHFQQVVSWFSTDARRFVQWTGDDFIRAEAIASLTQLTANYNVRQLAILMERQGLAGYFELHHHEGKNYLVRFVIRPDLRRKGIGRSVLEHLISHSDLPIALIVYRDNVAAAALYSSLGFVTLNTTEETDTLILPLPEAI